VALTRLLLDQAAGADGGVVHLLGDEASSRVRLAEDATALSLAAARAHDASGLSEFLEAARCLLGDAAERFAEDGVWYLVPADTELPLRPRAQHDSPTPTPDSMAAHAALRIWRATGDIEWRDMAEETLQRFVGLAERSAFAAGSALAAMCELLGGRRV
jgi:uncharacterized protein YyaL (SSP411 family)